MTPFPNGTGPANADTGPPAPHAAAGTGGTSAIGGAHGRPCLSGAAFRRFTLPALLGLLLLAAPLHAAYGTESGTPPSGDKEWKGEASTPSKRCPTLPFDGELTLGAGGSVPLALVGILYFVGRIIGKYAGSYLGCLFASKSKKVRNNLGLALIPQAGVAIGLAAMGARTLGGETGEMLETIILASSVLYELVGPACAKLALYLSGSYGENAPESAPAQPDTPKKSGLETLIERMKSIEEHLPAPVESSFEEEIAFTQAAQEQYDLAQYYHNRRFKGGRSTGGLHA